MKIYLVGGAVRDQIMGIKPSDFDYVVVGSNPAEMITLGYKCVGADFPVYLHPITGDEYALARTERKVSEGYQGFDCEWEGVSLEEDLSRRDLTMNALAQDLDTGEYIDPYGGIEDIRNRILRPVSSAFREDPLRVLRAARFMAKFDFTADWDDYLFSECNAVEHELQSLTPERVWKEMEKALNCVKPSAFFDWLTWFGMFKEWDDMRDTRQPQDHHPEIFVDIHTGLVMDHAAKSWYDPEIVFAALCHDFGKVVSMEKYGNLHGHEALGVPVVKAFCKRWKVPNNYRDLALLVTEHHTKVHSSLGRGDNKGMTPKSIMKLFEATSAISKSKRFSQILMACESDAKGRGGTQEERDMFEQQPYEQTRFLWECLQAVINTDTKSVSKRLLSQGKTGKVIGLEIRAERIKSIKGVYNQWKN